MADSERDLTDLLQRAFRYALALSHDRAVAEDLVQDACLGMARRNGPWDAGYLLASVRNRYIDRCRRHKVLSFQSLHEDDFVAPACDQRPWLDATLETALGRLGEGEREALYLAAVEGYTSQEIAGLTGRPVGTVLSTVHRAKLKLRRWMSTSEQGAHQ